MKTEIVRLDAKSPDGNVIARAAAIVRNGGLVVFPTETVYGIAADALNGAAVARLREIKRRPDGKPFTVHIHDISQVGQMGCRLDDRAQALAARFWPGPLTIVVAGSCGTTTGFRMPDHDVALRLLRAADTPVVAPSANRSGARPPRTAPEAAAELDGLVDLVLDAGAAAVGVESTVVDLSQDPYVVLRAGAIDGGLIARTIQGKPILGEGRPRHE